MVEGSSAAIAAATSGIDSSAPVENVAELKFGPEFEDIHVLSNAQVAVILQVSARSAVNRDEELNEVYRKTQKYVDRFNTMTNPEKEHQVRMCVCVFFVFLCIFVHFCPIFVNFIVIFVQLLFYLLFIVCILLKLY